MLNLLLFPASTFIKQFGLLLGSLVLASCILVVVVCAVFAGVSWTAFSLLGFASWLLISFPLLVWKEVNKLDAEFLAANAQGFDYRNLDLRLVIMPKAAVDILNLLRQLTRQAIKLNEKMVEINYSSEQVMDSADKVASNASIQSNATSSTAAAVTEMTHSLQEVADKIRAVHHSAQNTTEFAGKGRNNIQQLNAEISLVEEDIRATRASMRLLDEYTSNVLKESESVQSIAEQTNLLALNASIEAARAGELGRGFSVVADEVRNLADESMQCALTINKSIDSVNHQSQCVSENMRQVVEHALMCTKRAQAASNLLQQIFEESDKVQQQVVIVSTNTDQQAVATQEIAKHIENVVESARDNAEIARQTTEMANHLRTVTTDKKGAA